MHKIKIGLVGSGFAASLHMEAYKMVYGVEPVICALASTSEKAKDFADKLEDMMKFLIPNYAKEGKTNLVIAVGCTGGKHRSVTLARVLYDQLHAERSYGIRLEHRDIGKDALRKNK